MKQINFGSTYRIPITQPGVNNAKKEKLRTLVESYENGLVGKSKTGYARVSVPDSEDNNFVSKLKAIGYKVFQKFEGENISKENLDSFIKEKLDTRNYNQKGKKMKPMSREMKERRRYENSIDAPKKLKRETVSEDDIDNLKINVNENVNKKEEIPVKEPVALNKAEIRKSEDYLKIRNLYGEEFADAVFFGLK